MLSVIIIIIIYTSIYVIVSKPITAVSIFDWIIYIHIILFLILGLSFIYYFIVIYVGQW